MTSSSSVILSGIAATIHLLRASVDLVKVASKVEASKEKELLEAKKDQKNKQENIDKSNNRGSGKSVEKPRMSRYGLAASRSNMGQSMRMTSKYFLTFDRSQLLDENKKSDDVEQSNIEDVVLFDQSYKYVPAFALLVHFLCTLYFIILCVLSTVGTVDSLMYNEIPLGAAAVSSFIGVIMDIRDPQRVRFTAVQRVLYVFAAIVLVVSWIVSALLETRVELFDGISLAVMSMNALWALYEVKYLPFVDKNDGKKIRLTRKSLMIILKPYFWPDSTGDVGSAAGNRCRAMMTWVFVASSKVCNVAAPIFIGKATTALSRGEYDRCVHNVIFYCVIAFCGVLLKELQSLIYLKVAQAAFVQLAEISFRHLHGLSLDWHLRKKLGEVIRSMDRGILACDTLIKYLFLWLLPAMLESILVCIVFATYFNYFPLSVSIFFFVFAYILWTIVVTLWRKKYRKAVAKSDNDWHDKCTDSLVNFETVKYFTAEDYEMKRFANSVEHFQMGSVKVQASLSFLNISQQVMLQFCLATSLILAAYGIRDRLNCCVDNGCETGNSECCSEISQSVCPGLELGDFVSVLSYTINLFIPLNFLGSVYNAIVMSVVDLTHLSELLAETADVVDTEDAQPLSKTNNIDPDIAVEFDNVVFHYPTQPDTKGLKGLSFKMKRGTTTAIVGPTGMYGRSFFYVVTHSSMDIISKVRVKLLSPGFCFASTMFWVAL